MEGPQRGNSVVVVRAQSRCQEGIAIKPFPRQSCGKAPLLLIIQGTGGIPRWLAPVNPITFCALPPPSVGGRPPMPASTPRRSPLVAVHSSRHRLGQDPTPQVASRCRDMAQASACDPTGCQPAWAGPLSRGPRVFCSRCTGSRPAGWVNAMSSLVETLSQHTWQRWLRWSRSHCAGTCPCNAPER